MAGKKVVRNKKKVSKNIINGVAHIRSTFNNTIVTISDTEGNVLYMNDKSKSVFGDMLGKNMMSCHKQSSQDTIKRLIGEKATNVYTIQKGDVKKMIYQTPWYVDGEIKGLIEYSIILPDEMPHYVR